MEDDCRELQFDTSFLGDYSHNDVMFREYVSYSQWDFIKISSLVKRVISLQRRWTSNAFIVGDNGSVSADRKWLRQAGAFVTVATLAASPCVYVS